ncbi:MAG: nuclear transport factor 2 family protein [Gracilimonas sp.]|uniref:nuclear transport factor 2 family protein n=1 Tax=Gracilimonas sp. TaxID=1974203 RepID=UPI00199DA23F|nr:nuclear transport factor 2 family protein [Gracilimonas sp.]MBD3615340.1 nuclear transport factor 2 family protein [Gracilimonas sp.]
MKSILLATTIFLTALSGVVKAQNSTKQEVQATIETLFEGMLEADGQKVTASFTLDAIMQTIVKNEQGKVTVRNGSLEAFVSSIGSAEPGRLNEKIGRYEIKVDGELASAWTPYEFYVGEEFSHCGVNSFQLMKTEDGWKIFHIVDTRRKDNCAE